MLGGKPKYSRDWIMDLMIDTQAPVEGRVSDMEELRISYNPIKALEFNAMIYGNEKFRAEFYSNPTDVLQRFEVQSTEPVSLRQVRPFTAEEIDLATKVSEAMRVHGTETVLANATFSARAEFPMPNLAFLFLVAGAVFYIALIAANVAAVTVLATVAAALPLYVSQG